MLICHFIYANEYLVSVVRYFNGSKLFPNPADDGLDIVFPRKKPRVKTYRIVSLNTRHSGY
jgi:hypothetical protein